jgi:hypothetical protein
MPLTNMPVTLVFPAVLNLQMSSDKQSARRTRKSVTFFGSELVIMMQAGIL